jgi:CRP/FNR family transcriptional regulator, cyclic AMP receptor protein
VDSDSGNPARSVVATAFGCGDGLADHILSQSRIRNHPARATILRTGDQAQSIHLMLEGVAQAIALSFDGRLVLVQDYRRGDLFGEGAILANARIDEDVIAVDPVSAAQFGALGFIGLMEKHSSVAIAVSRVLTRRLATANRRMVEGATLSSNGRIHAELLRRARASEHNEIRPAPVLTELALHVQTARETVSRAIGNLEKRGIIKRTPDALTIVAPHRLEELVY